MRRFVVHLCCLPSFTVSDDINIRLVRLEFSAKVHNDPIHRMADLTSRGHSASASARAGTKVVIGDICPICGVKNVLSYAHIIVRGAAFDEQLKARLDEGYCVPYDTTNFRNFIPMCGTHGAIEDGVRTCHDLFDDNKFVILPTLISDTTFQLFALHDDAGFLHGKEIDLGYKPYCRGLAGRAKMGFKKYSHDTTRVTPEFVARLDFSESSSNCNRGEVTDTEITSVEAETRS
jgi:hypothetical protein